MATTDIGGKKQDLCALLWVISGKLMLMVLMKWGDREQLISLQNSIDTHRRRLEAQYTLSENENCSYGSRSLKVMGNPGFQTGELELTRGMGDELAKAS